MPRLAAIFPVLLALATGCATVSHPIRPMQLTDHTAALLAEGRARVPVEDGSLVTVRADEVIDVRIAEGATERPVRLTVRELVAGCGGGVTEPSCLAGRAVDQPVITRRRSRLSGEAMVGVVAIAGVGTAMGWCTLACEDPGREFRGAGLATAGIVAGLGLAMVLLGME